MTGMLSAFATGGKGQARTAPEVHSEVRTGPRTGSITPVELESSTEFGLGRLVENGHCGLNGQFSDARPWCEVVNDNFCSRNLASGDLRWVVQKVLRDDASRRKVLRAVTFRSFRLERKRGFPS